jgi:hypothetical protein
MESNQHPALLEREDCALVAWYRSLYAPRTGGAYDGHHRTAGIAGRSRRRGGNLAACHARGQQVVMPVIGFLNGQSAEAWDNLTDAFLKGLSESGYTEGGNLRNPGQVFLRRALSNAWPPSKRA